MRNGHATKTAEPNELYDTLSPEARDTWDAIGKFGYTPEQGVTGLWFARKTGSKHAATVGPIESLTALLPAVEEEIRLAAEHEDHSTDDSNVLDMRQNARVKQPYLPGAEDVPELDDLADECLDLQDKKSEISTAYKDAQLKMIDLMDTHGRTTYARGGWNMKITNKRTLQLKQDKNRKVQEVDTVAEKD